MLTMHRPTKLVPVQCTVDTARIASLAICLAAHSLTNCMLLLWPVLGICPVCLNTVPSALRVLPLQVTSGWTSPPSSPSDAQKSISLTLLGNPPIVKTVQDVGKMPFTEFTALYAVSHPSALAAHSKRS